MPKRKRIHLEPMLKNKIVKAPNIMLNKKTTPLTKDNYIKIVNTFIKRSLRHRKGAIGIAANQIHMPYSLFIAQIVPDVWKVFINPTIPKTSKSLYYNSELINSIEGCLSLPGSEHTVKRKELVELVYRDMSWKPQISKCEGLLAKIVQHEVDHLNGILIDKNMDWS